MKIVEACAVQKPVVKKPEEFECGNLYVMNGQDVVCMYCRVGEGVFMLVSIERGNWWTRNMTAVDRAEWVDVTNQYELRKVSNG